MPAGEIHRYNSAQRRALRADGKDLRSPNNPDRAENRAAAWAEREGIADDPISGLLSRLSEKISGLKGDDAAARDNLEYYARYVIQQDSPEFAEDSGFLKRFYTALQYTDDDLLVLGPRFSAKSTAGTVTYVSWQIGKNPLLRFMISVATQEKQGRPFIRQLKQIIENNERYIEMFGQLKPDKPDKWDADEFIIKRTEPPGGLKDPTVATCGVGTAVPGKRADVIICDDIVTQESSRSQTVRDATYQFVMMTLWPILVPNGRKIVIGSRWHSLDLYGKLAEMWGLTIPEPDVITSAELRPYYEPEEEQLSLDELRAKMVPNPNAKKLIEVT